MVAPPEPSSGPSLAEVARREGRCAREVDEATDMDRALACVRLLHAPLPHLTANLAFDFAAWADARGRAAALTPSERQAALTAPPSEAEAELLTKYADYKCHFLGGVAACLGVITGRPFEFIIRHLKCHPKKRLSNAAMTELEELVSQAEQDVNLRFIFEAFKEPNCCGSRGTPLLEVLAEVFNPEPELADADYDQLAELLRQLQQRAMHILDSIYLRNTTQQLATPPVERPLLTFQGDASFGAYPIPVTVVNEVDCTVYDMQQFKWAPECIFGGSVHVAPPEDSSARCSCRTSCFHSCSCAKDNRCDHENVLPFDSEGRVRYPPRSLMCAAAFFQTLPPPPPHFAME
eukprot:TRINITY_DN2880_c0_g1_i1.p1 TRINITY_DN2880_c0_g1~~TRINITY_DN2880_c0_g1_i1.p1  ORF type:complete len:373 (+),score=93.84 TRINITY_DN2880_c0_g1_i1:78-1121(+)